MVITLTLSQKNSPKKKLSPWKYLSDQHEKLSPWKYLSDQHEKLPPWKYLSDQHEKLPYPTVGLLHYNRNAPPLNRLQLFSNPLFRCQPFNGSFNSTTWFTEGQLQGDTWLPPDGDTWLKASCRKWAPNGGLHLYKDLSFKYGIATFYPWIFQLTISFMIFFPPSHYFLIIFYRLSFF